MEEFERIAKRQYDRMNAKSPVPKGFESQMYERLKKKAYETHVVPFENMVSNKENVRPETLDSLLKAKQAHDSFKSGVDTVSVSGIPIKNKIVADYVNTNNLNEAKKNAKLESMGIDIDRETPVQSWKIGLAETPEIGLQTILSEHFKQPIPVKKIEGEYVYRDPTDGRMVKADIGAAAGWLAATPDIADVGATVAMPASALKSAAVKKEMGVSGVASGLTELVRLTAGNIVGINDLNDKEIIGIAAEKGGINALLTGVGGGAYKLLKGIDNFWRGGIFTHEEAAKHGIATEYANEIVEESNRISKQIGSGDEFNPTAYQRTAAKGAGDINIGAMEADIRKRGELGQEFADVDYANLQALGESVRGLHKPAMPPVVGEGDITDVAARKLAASTAKMETVVQKSVDENLAGIHGGSGVPFEKVGEDTKEFLIKADKEAKGLERAEWAKVEEIGGYDKLNKKYGFDVPEGENTQFYRKLYREQSREAITQAGKKAAGDIFTGTGTKTVEKEGTQIQKIMARVHKSLEDNKIKKGDLAYVNAEISALKAEVRSRSGNQAFTDSQKLKVNDLIKAIEADRAIFLTRTGRGDLLEQIKKSETVTKEYHEVFDRSKVGDLLSVNKHGVPKIKTNEYVDSVLKGDIVEAQQLKRVIDKNPDAKLTFRQGIANKYTRDVYDNGKLNKKKSDAFFNNPVINEFFTKAEIVGFKRRGDFAIKTQKLVDKLSNFKKTASARFGTATLAKTDGRSLVKNILGDSKLFKLGGKERKDAVSKVKYIKNMYAVDHPKAWFEFKNEYNKKISESLLDTDGMVKSSKLENLVSDSKMMELATEINGKRYVHNLKKMNEMSKILNKKATTLSKDERTQVIVQAMRGAYFAPLSRRGRVFSAYLTWDSAATKRVMKEAMLDPSIMAKVADLSKNKKWTREFFEKSAVLGLYGDTKDAFDEAKEYADLTGEKLN